MSLHHRLAKLEEEVRSRPCPGCHLFDGIEIVTEQPGEELPP